MSWWFAGEDNSLPISSGDLMALAERLEQGLAGADEASERASISRAYYSAVIHLRDKLSNTPGATSAPTKGLHGYLRQALRGSGRTHLKKMAQRLATLHALRESADYETAGPRPTPHDISDAIKRAKDLIADFDGLGVPDILRIRP